MSQVRTLHELTCAFTEPLDAVSAGELRRRFAELTARALPLLTADQLDLDDVLLEYGAWLGDADEDIAVTLENLSDPASWIAAYNDARRSQGLPPCDPAEVCFRRLRLTVLREVDCPLPDFRVQDRPR